MRDWGRVRAVVDRVGPGVGSPMPAGEAERLRQEHGELWQWAARLERLAEAGLQARGVAHDLGNTLTSLLATAELALLDRDAESMRRALSKSMDLSRVAAERLKLFRRYARPAPIDEAADVHLADVVGEAVLLLAHPIRKAEVRVSTAFASQAEVPGLRVELLQIVGAALLAVIAGFEGASGRLTIRTDDADDEVVLTIRRTSTGRPAACEDRWWAGGPSPELRIARRLLAGLGGRLEVADGAEEAVVRLPHATRSVRRTGWAEAPAAFAPHPNGRARRA